MHPFKIFEIIARNNRRSRLKATDFSIISNNCIGGVFTNCLGEQFRSPTVNLAIYQWEYPVFCRYLREYSTIPVSMPTEAEIKESFEKLDYPIGILRGGEKGLPDITIYFIHYHTFEEAKEKWETRFQRVNWDNLYFIMNCTGDCKDEWLDAFYALPYEKKLSISTKRDQQRWPNNYCYSFYEREYSMDKMYRYKMKGLARYRWLDEFDYVAWLNEGIIQKNPIFAKTVWE